MVKKHVCNPVTQDETTLPSRIRKEVLILIDDMSAIT